MLSQDPSDIFAEKCLTSLQELFDTQKSVLHKVAAEIYTSLSGGGVWNIFGSGHSHMGAEEAFHRAGGLIPVNAWLEEYLMPHMGPARSGSLERLPGLGKIIVDFYGPQPGEVLTILSNSGINTVPVEVAECAKNLKVKTVAITNVKHSNSAVSRHPKGKKLFEVCDEVIDIGGVIGDAAVRVPGLDVAVGPLSSLLTAAVINYVAVHTCFLFSKSGQQAPVYLSANIPGGDERNKKLEMQYRGRIKRLY